LNGQAPSDSLDLVLEMMEMDPFIKDGDPILDSIHFRTSILHGMSDERRDIAVQLGKNGSDNIKQLSSPFLLTRKFLSSLPYNAKLGIALGQAMAGMPVNIYPGSPKEIGELIKAHRPVKLVNFGPDRSDFDIEILRTSDLIEIDVMDEVNDIQRLLPEVEKGKDLIRLVELLDEITSSPKVVTIEPEHLRSDIDFHLVTRIDLLGLNCRPHQYGRCTNSLAISSMMEALRHMVVFKSVEKGLKLMVTARTKEPGDMVKLIAMGANVICLDILTRDFLTAYLRTRSSIPPEEELDLDDHNEEMDWAEIGELYSEMMNLLSDGMRETLTDLNIGSLEGLSRENLITTDYNTASITGLALAGFGGPVPFWRHRSE